MMTWLFSGLITDSLARQSWGRQGRTWSFPGQPQSFPPPVHPPHSPHLVPCLVHSWPLGRVVEIEEDVLTALGLKAQRFGSLEEHGELGSPCLGRPREYPASLWEWLGKAHLRVSETEVQSSIIREETKSCQEHPVLEKACNQTLFPSPLRNSPQLHRLSAFLPCLRCLVSQEASGEQVTSQIPP